MPYVGVCGGALMASSPEGCKYRCGLDLLAGRTIYYDEHSQAHKIGNSLTFTEKYAFALLLRGDRIDAVCFPCVKNAGKVWPFAANYSIVLQNIVRQLASEWQPFYSRTKGCWFFNLCGHYCLASEIKEQ